MPETKSQALARAKKIGYPKSTVVQARNKDWFLLRVALNLWQLRAYANCRMTNENKGQCAGVAWKVQKIVDRKK